MLLYVPKYTILALIKPIVLSVNPYGGKYPVKKGCLIDTSKPIYGQMFAKHGQNIHHMLYLIDFFRPNGWIKGCFDIIYK